MYTGFNRASLLTFATARNETDESGVGGLEIQNTELKDVKILRTLGSSFNSV